MENPEEVLQALDEFQKLRPAEIPRELEEYLSWVAKTGDPVYQWSLIKALFREKLARVMTEFYESCPSLELSPCPNVEHFNYDSMKSSLLERLESFANAPFTVQRICELLTAPRKEYNRVDKFMRAIEKNILVVSTREPGTGARRSENGDGLVNGSIEDMGHSAQPAGSLTSSQEVEMESWVRDCEPVTTVTLQVRPETDSMLETGRSLGDTVTVAVEPTLVKSLPPVERNSGHPLEKTMEDQEAPVPAKLDDSSSNFVPVSSEIAGIATLASQIQPQEVNLVPGVQNLSAIVHETSGISGEVPEAIMNEDTSSQPSLDMENNESESFDNSIKLQTTFKSKDFLPKFYLEESKLTEKTIMESESVRTHAEAVDTIEKPCKAQQEQSDPSMVAESCEVAKTEEPVKNVTVLPDTESSMQLASREESLVQSSTPLKSEQPPVELNENTELCASENTLLSVESKPVVSETITRVDSTLVANVSEEPEATNPEKSPVVPESIDLPSPPAEDIPNEPAEEVTPAPDIAESETVVTDLEAAKVLEEEPKEITSNCEPAVECTKPLVKEPEEPDTVTPGIDKAKNPNSQQDSLTIEETIGDYSKVSKSIVPDPIPIVEEPKDVKHAPKNLQTITTIVEISSTLEEQPASSKVTTSVVREMSVEDDQPQVAEGSPQLTAAQHAEPLLAQNQTETAICATSVGEVAPAESMEVDGDEAAPVFEQDEPMEQESSEPLKS